MAWPGDRLWHYVGISLILILGIALVFLPSVYGWKWDQGILTEIGKGFIIAGVVAISVEPWMRKSFARDVFYAAFGTTCQKTSGRRLVG